MSKFFFVRPSKDKTDAYLPVFCPSELLAPTIDLLTKTYGEPHVESTHTVYLDAGGMMMLNRPHENFPLSDGTRVDVPSQDAGVFHERLRRACLGNELRAHRYYAISSFLRIVFLTPAQRKGMLGRLAAILPAASRRADVAEAELVRHLQAVRAAGGAILSSRLGDKRPL